MLKPLDHTLVFAMIGLMPVVGIWLFKRDWLHDIAVNGRIKAQCLCLGAVGIAAFCLSPRHLEFLFLLFPIYQVSVYNVLLWLFRRRYYRNPIPPPRFS